MVPAAEKITTIRNPTIIMQLPQRTHQVPEKNRDTTPKEHWELLQITLTCLCQVQTIQELPKIWADISSP